MLEGDEKSNLFLWKFCDGRNSYFEIHDARSRDVEADFLSKAACHKLVYDVFSGYERALRIANEKRLQTNNIQYAYCNAHARRKFIEAQDASPDEVELYRGVPQNLAL